MKLTVFCIGSNTLNFIKENKRFKVLKLNEDRMQKIKNSLLIYHKWRFEEKNVDVLH